MLLRTLLFSLLLTLSGLAHSVEAVKTIIHTDHLGSPIMGRSMDGKTVFTRHYGPYGQAESSGNDDLDVGYTGHLADTNSGLVYAGARWYRPGIERFLSSDPAGVDPGMPSSFNRYIYGANNPFKYKDPDGRDVVFGVDPNGAGGNGHTTLYFQDSEGAWYAYSEGAAGQTSSGGNVGFLLGLDAKAGVSITRMPKRDLPADGYRIKTNKSQDRKISISALKSAKRYNSGKEEYNLYNNNCTDAAVGVVNNSGAGIKVENPATTVRPNSWIKEVKNDRNVVTESE